MSDTFDPYHEWLGIPKWDQPANAYRLLGIQVFEQDREVIANAADRIMKHLRTYQTSKRSQLSQKLLNEVANAKICLLDKQSKAQYDAELAQKMVPSDLPTSPEADDSQSGFDAFLASSQADRAKPTKKTSLVPFIVLAVVALAIIGGSITFYLIGEANKREEQRLVQVAALEAEAKAAKENADRKAKEETKRKLKQAAERKAKEEADRKAKEKPHLKKKQEVRRKKKEEPERTTKVEYHDNGKKKSEIHHKNGKRDGLYTSWHKDGQKKYEAHYKYDKQDGVETRWHENGQMKKEFHYKNGKWDGLQTRWYKNGQKKSESHYKNGKLDGLSTGWDENGKKERETHWKDGKLASRKES